MPNWKTLLRRHGNQTGVAFPKWWSKFNWAGTGSYRTTAFNTDEYMLVFYRTTTEPVALAPFSQGSLVYYSTDLDGIDFPRILDGNYQSLTPLPGMTPPVVLTRRF